MNLSNISSTVGLHSSLFSQKIMATTTLASPSPRFLFQHAKADGPLLHVQYFSQTKLPFSRSLIYCGSSSKAKRLPLKPISAVGSGLKATMTDPDKNLISIKNYEIVVESKDDDKMQVRVDLTGKETRIVFQKILRNLARTAPPVPGFRRAKGGKTSNVPEELLLRILGEDQVTKFTIEEIVSTTLADYAKKENLTVKENKVNTIQTAEELKSIFVPGNEFGFNATLEFEKSTEDEELTDEDEELTDEDEELTVEDE